MNIFMYTNRFGVYMAGKLYWRIKKDGKWTWSPVKVDRVIPTKWDDKQLYLLYNSCMGEEE